MRELLQFAALGLGAGAVYALVGQGAVLVYRGSGTVNFAHGAMAMLGGFLHWELHHQRGWPLPLSISFAVSIVAALGAFVHLAVMRPLAASAPLVRVIATLALLTVFTAGAELYWGGEQRIVPSFFAVERWSLGSIGVPSDRIILLGIAVVITALLWACFRFTRVGLAVTAAAEDERAAAALGWSPDVLATISWTAGGALAALAGILVMPITGLQVGTLTLIVIAALAAALVGGFRSYWSTFGGGVAIGIAQSLTVRYVHVTGAADAVPFLAVTVLLVLRGRALPLRSHLLERLPRLGPERLSLWVLTGPLVLAVLCLAVFPVGWNHAVTVSAVTAILILSVVVLTGFAGQISLAQFAIGGLGALVAGRLVSSHGLPLELALVAGVAASLVLGLLFALPALRTRGLNLAVVSLGLGLAVQTVVFGNPDYTGGATGTPVGEVTFLGIEIDRLDHPGRYAAFTLLWLGVAIVLVRNVRASRAGRRLIAVRTNERAAASLGVGVVGAKLYAFAISSVIAGIGGTLLAFQDRVIVYTRFSPFESINAVVLGVLGGVGFVLGPVAGSLLAVGGIAAIVTNEINIDDTWIVLLGGVLLLVQLVVAPDGIVAHPSDLLRRRRERMSPTSDVELNAASSPRVSRSRLAASGVSVRFGGVWPVREVDLDVATGEIVGLIGPNGAGKTTLIDALSGFVKIADGSVHLDGTSIARWSPARRTRAGIVRTFQSLELFEDLTVRENILAGSDGHGIRPYLTDAFWPKRDELTSVAVRAIHDLGLTNVLDETVGELSYGRRRLVSIARALAAQPSILLLDEPAAGLSDAETAALRGSLRHIVEEWGIGILLVEHDMSLVMSVCDRVVAVVNGSHVAAGSPSEVREDARVRAAYLGGDTPDGGADQPYEAVPTP